MVVHPCTSRQCLPQNVVLGQELANGLLRSRTRWAHASDATFIEFQAAFDEIDPQQIARAFNQPI
jgi:hypothetical protein